MPILRKCSTLVAIFKQHSCPKQIPSMRINGNYFERYFFTVFPWILLTGFFCFFSTIKIWVILLSLILGSFLITFFDSLNFRRHKLSKVFLIGDKLYVGQRMIEQNEISVIRPHKDVFVLLLVFEIYLNDNTCLKFMDRSKSYFYKSNNKLNSKSLDILFSKFPELRKKMRAEKN